MNRFKENDKVTCDVQYTYAFYCENFNERGRLRNLGIERMILILSAPEGVNYPWCRLDSCGSVGTSYRLLGAHSFLKLVVLWYMM
jgi:hypothetical protein